MLLKLDCYGATERGVTPLENLDQFLVADLVKLLHVHYSSLSLDDGDTLTGATQGQVLMVADGLAPADKGLRAGQLAINTMTQHLLDVVPWFFRSDRAPCEDMSSELRAALDRCQAALQSERHRERERLGTTFTMAWIVWPNLHIVHMGDSRAYLFRGKTLRRITADQTLGPRQAAPGAAAETIWQHSLWSYLGVDLDRYFPQLHRDTLQQGDTLLLCTDGLTAELSDAELTQELSRTGRASALCQRLIQLALDRRAADNVTAVVARIHDARQSLAMMSDQAADELKLDDGQLPALTAASQESPGVEVVADSFESTCQAH
jgi:protein phosphatase